MNETSTMLVPFWRVCKANFFLYASIYILFPSLVVEMTDRLDIYITEASLLYLTLVAGRIVAGPFINYLVESFKRKHLCVISLIVIILIIWGYSIVIDYRQLLLFTFIQGVAFGIISASLIGLGIDLTLSESRNRANVIYCWFTRAGMIFGVALGSFLFLNKGFQPVIYASVVAGIIAALYLLFVRVPFRAPIGSGLLSLDRFLLPRSWVLIINLVMIAFVPGIFIPAIFFEANNLLVIQGFSIPLYVFIFAGFIPGIFVFKNKNAAKYLIGGLLVMVISTASFILSDLMVVSILAAVLFGISLAMITPVVLMLFVDMSSHCERVSANVTHSLSWGIGIVAGIIISCYLNDNFSSMPAYHAGMFSASLALVFFILVTYPFYRKRKVR